LKQHKKTSNNKTTTNDILKLKLRKSHKSKKKSSKSTRRYPRRQHPKKNHTISREFLSSSESDSTKELTSAADPVIIIDSCGNSNATVSNTGTAASSSTVLDSLRAEPSSSISGTSYHQNLLTPETFRNDSREFNEIIDYLQFDGLGDDIRNLVEGKAALT
jgi:hypothetical protein